MENGKIECRWLNKNYGDGYWICNGFLKPTNREICRNCPERKSNNGKWNKSKWIIKTL